MTEKNVLVMKRLRVFGMVTLGALAFNIMSGVTVAGIDAGKVFNTWPKMNNG